MKYLFFVALLDATLLGAGPSAQGRQMRVIYGPSTEVSANDIRHNGSSRTTYARGQVRIITGHSTITADEAELVHLKDTPQAVDFAVDLRGSVRVVIAPSTAR